jgi:predicted PurR-regulated permease PerM
MKVKMLRRANLLIECKSYFIEAVNVHVQKIKWYQTKLFKAIIFVVAVVLSLWDGGFTLTNIVPFLTNMAIGLVISFALNTLVKVLVDMGIVSNAFAIALIAVVAVYGMAYGLNPNMDFTLVTTAIKVVEATGKVYALQAAKETEEYQVKADKLKEENKKLEEDQEKLDERYTSDHIGRLSADLQRMVDAVSGPLIETRDQFLARTLSMKVVTEELTYSALMARLHMT